jgi:hypothetical protein
MDRATNANLSRPHGEEPAEASAKAGVSNHGAAPSFETRPAGAPQDEADARRARRAQAAQSRLLDLHGLLVEKCAAVLDTIAQTPALDDPRAPQPPPSVLRWTANLMALWQLCGHSACRRARTCKRRRGLCVARCAAQVPDPVRSGVAVLLRGRRDGLPYEALRKRARKEVAAVEAWLTQARERA